MSFFDKNFRKEDLFLYLVTLTLMVSFGKYFIESRDIILATISYDNSRVPQSQAYLFELQRMKYDFGAKVLAANSLRNNMSFIVGTILCLLGSMVVVRRLREQIELNLKVSEYGSSLKSTSPGVFLALMGSTMIIASIVFKDKYNVVDGETQIRIEQEKPIGNPTGIQKDTTRSIVIER